MGETATGGRNRGKRFASILVIFSCLLCGASSQTIKRIKLNSSVLGDSTGSPTGIFNQFGLSDVTEDPIGTGGQQLFDFIVPEEDGDSNLEVSTCIGSAFDTYLVVLGQNPTTVANPAVIAESANDILCRTGRTKASLSTKISPGTYFIVLTGNGAAEGKFNLTVTAVKATPTPVPWGLDRIDQRNLPLDQDFSVTDEGDGVWVYVIDSGIRVTHSEFEGRATAGYDFVNNKENSADDCTGHGTHVAGIIAGKTFGVSRKANVVGIRVFGCDSIAKTSAIVDAISWVLVDSKFQQRSNVILSLMFTTTSDEASILGSTIRGVMRTGIPVIVPAGNNAGSTCQVYPSSHEQAIAVSATDSRDARSSSSNFGKCTNIFAPGSLITSSWHTSDTAWKDLSGTAQAAAHVVGAVANLMAINKGIQATAVKKVIESISTKDTVGNVPKNESTRFVFVRSVPRISGNPPKSPNVYLYTVLGVGNERCSSQSKKFEPLRTTFADVLSISSRQLEASCRTNLSRQAGLTSEQVLFRVETAERMAAAMFTALEKAIGDEKRKTEESLGFQFTVIEQPWAVDSTPIIFWGAPSFPDTGGASLSSGAIAGAVVAVICVIAVLAAIGWVVYRKVTKADEIESMKGSADLERGPVHFDDFANMGNDGSVSRSFRNIARAMSFRRSGSIRGGYGDGGEERGGMNKMGSFIGGPNSSVVKDVVRMQSFGGEAFAGLDSLSRGDSSADNELSSSGSRSRSISQTSVPSFRGFNNLVINGKNRSDQETISDDESMRMRSLGGEAFAMMGFEVGVSSIGGPFSPQHGNGNGSSPTGGGIRTSERSSSIRGDASIRISKDGEERQDSFFGGVN